MQKKGRRSANYNFVSIRKCKIKISHFISQLNINFAHRHSFLALITTFYVILNITLMPNLNKPTG